MSTKKINIACTVFCLHYALDEIHKFWNESDNVLKKYYKDMLKTAYNKIDKVYGDGKGLIDFPYPVTKNDFERYKKVVNGVRVKKIGKPESIIVSANSGIPTDLVEKHALLSTAINFYEKDYHLLGNRMDKNSTKVILHQVNKYLDWFETII